MLNMLKKIEQAYAKNFAPKLFEVLLKQKYGKAEFKRDVIAGMTVAVVSIPLAMALAIASGVSPAQGCIQQLWLVSLRLFWVVVVFRLADRPALLLW